MPEEYANFNEASHFQEHERRAAEPGIDVGETDRDAFLTLHGFVLRDTPVPPPADPTGDQQRRSASVRQLLQLFTGQRYDEPEDPAGGGNPSKAIDDAGELPRTSGALNSSALGDSPDTDGLRVSRSVSDDNFSSGGVGRSADLPGAEDAASALPDGQSPSMPDVPWTAPSANSSPPRTKQGPTNAGPFGIDDAAGSQASPPASYSGTDSTTDADASATLDDSNNYPVHSASALNNDSLALQLSGPIDGLPTALPADLPAQPTSDANEQLAGLAKVAEEAASEAGINDATLRDEPLDASSDAAAYRTSSSPSTPSASRGEASSADHGITINVSLADLEGLLRTATQATLPAYQAAAQEATSNLAASLATALAQVRDLSNRLEEQQSADLTRSAQMLAIYG